MKDRLVPTLTKSYLCLPDPTTVETCNAYDSPDQAAMFNSVNKKKKPRLHKLPCRPVQRRASGYYTPLDPHGATYRVNEICTCLRRQARGEIIRDRLAYIMSYITHNTGEVAPVIPLSWSCIWSPSRWILPIWSTPQYVSGSIGSDLGRQKYRLNVGKPYISVISNVSAASARRSEMS